MMPSTTTVKPGQLTAAGNNLGAMQQMRAGGGAMPAGASPNGMSGLAALFQNNAPASPAGAPSPLATILAPRAPNIGMPPRAQTPVQSAPRTAAPPAFQSINQLMSYMHANPGKVSPQVANSYKSVLKNPWGR